MKTLKNAHNTGFLRLARPGSAGRVVSVWGEKVGRAAPALCLSLLNSPLVNRVLGHSSWSAKPGSTAKYSGIRRGGLSLKRTERWPARPISGKETRNPRVTFARLVSLSIRRGFCGLNREGNLRLPAYKALTSEAAV